MRVVDITLTDSDWDSAENRVANALSGVGLAVLEPDEVQHYLDLAGSALFAVGFRRESDV